MKKFFRKSLVYLIMTMLVLPTWLVVGISKADHAQAALDGSDLIISEVAAGIGNSSNEFVELYNPTDKDILLVSGNYELVFVNSENQSTNKTLTFNKTSILSHGYFLLASGNVGPGIQADATFSNGLTGNSGVVLKKVVTEIPNQSYAIDSIAWGNPKTGALDALEGESAPYGVVIDLKTNMSVERKKDSLTGEYVDTNDNNKDFFVQENPNPDNFASSLLSNIKKGTSITLDKSSKTVFGNKEAIDWTIHVSYPEPLIKQVDSSYLVDAKINSSIPIPKNTELDLYYGSSVTALGTYKFDSEVGTSEIWLSDIIKSINKDLPNRVQFSDEVGLSNWRFVVRGLTDSIYNLRFSSVISNEDFYEPSNIYLGSLSESLTVDLSVLSPVGVKAEKIGSDVKISWAAVLNDLSGIAGYNVYSSTDNFVNNKTRLNLVDPIIPNSYSVSGLADGTYAFEVEAIDKAGNVSVLSIPSNSVVINSAQLTTPVIFVSNLSNSNGRFVHVEWKGIGNNVEKYEVYVNGVTSLYNTIDVNSNEDDTGVLYQRNVKIYSDGTYNVYVKAWKGQSYSVSTQRPVSFTTAPTVSNVVPEETAPVSVAAPSASAAVTAPAETTPTPTSTSTPTDDSGIIKGDENTATNDTNKINWTPWIVLFCLIILAGAATGGYFYWFNGEEEVAAVVRESKKTADVQKVTKDKPILKDKNDTKKSKRW